jgi:hypothetical protein
MKLLGALDGKKTYLGYAGTQLFGLGIWQSLQRATEAWLAASTSGDYVSVIEPTAEVLAQVLLLIGVGHKAVKDVRGKI